MAIIKATFGEGGKNLQPGGSNNPTSLAIVLRDVADDLETLRAAHNTLAAKLNADAGVTDTNYATITSVKTIKG
jgi:hypothetical protein